MKSIHIGGLSKEPTLDYECYEAVWSKGESCKNCIIECYRKGWSKIQATADNKRLVKIKSIR